MSPGTTEVTEGHGSKRALDRRKHSADLGNRPRHDFKSAHDHVKNVFSHGPLLLMYVTLVFKEVPGRWGTCTDKYLITFPTTPTPSYLLHARASNSPLSQKGLPRFLSLHSSKSEPSFISGDVMCFLWGPPAWTWSCCPLKKPWELSSAFGCHTEWRTQHTGTHRGCMSTRGGGRCSLRTAAYTAQGGNGYGQRPEPVLGFPTDCHSFPSNPRLAI